MEKYGTARQAIDESIKRRMRFDCHITEARIQTHTFNTYRFPMVTTLTRTRLNVTYSVKIV